MNARIQLRSPLFQGGFGCGVTGKILYAGKVSFPQALQLGVQLGALTFQKRGFIPCVGFGVDDGIGNGDVCLGVPLQQGQQHVSQLFVGDVLGTFAAAADIAVALPVVGGGVYQRTAAAGTADQAGQPALMLCNRPAVVFPLGLDGCHTPLRRLPGVKGDQRFMLCVSQDDIFI